MQRWSCRWVIRFLGGAWCWDAASCAARWASTPYLMSSLRLPPVTSATAHVEGLPDVVLQVWAHIRLGTDETCHRRGASYGEAHPRMGKQ